MTNNTTPRKRRLHRALIIAASVLLVGGIAFGTILMLKQFTPINLTKNTSDQASTKSPVDRAGELLAKGDYDGAKSAYESILKTYKAQGNEAGVQDMEAQLQAVEALAQSTKDPENTNKSRISTGSQPQ